MPLNGRDFTELALYVPGVAVSAAGGAGSFAINGARPETTNYLVDGIDDRNVRGGATAAQYRCAPGVQDGDVRLLRRVR